MLDVSDVVATRVGAPSGPFQQRHVAEEAALAVGVVFESTRHMTGCLECTGRLDVDRLERAVHHVIAHQPAFRASVRHIDRSPGPMVRAAAIEQCIQAPGTVHLAISRLPGVDGPGEAALAERIATYCRAPFDYREAPLLRVGVLRASDERDLVLVVAAEAICDRVSRDIVLHDIMSLYAADAMPTTSDSVSVDDYLGLVVADPQQSTTWRDSMAYWKEQWGAFRREQVGMLDIPLAVPQPAWRPRYRPIVVDAVTLGATETARIRTFATSRGLTLEAYALGIFATVFSRYTRKQRFPLWMVFRNRSTGGAERVVGCVSNPMIVGFDCGTVSSIDELLDRTNRAVSEAQRHEYVPLNAVWAELGCAADRGVRVVFEYDEPLHGYAPRRMPDGITMTPKNLQETLPLDGICQLRCSVGVDSITLALTAARDAWEFVPTQQLVRECIRIMTAVAAQDEVHALGSTVG